MTRKLLRRAGMRVVIVVSMILAGLDARPPSNDLSASSSKLTFDEKLALSSKNRPRIQVEQPSRTSGNAAFQFPSLPTWAPVKPSPSFAPPLPISFQPWIYAWPTFAPVKSWPTFAPVKSWPTFAPVKSWPTFAPVKSWPTFAPVKSWPTFAPVKSWPTFAPVKSWPTFAPVKSWPVLPHYEPLQIQPLATKKGSHPAPMDYYNLRKSELSLPGPGAEIQNIGNTRTSHSVSFVLITRGCDPSNGLCSDTMTLRNGVDSNPFDARITEDDVEEIAEFLTDIDEANGSEDAQEWNQQDWPAFLPYSNYAAPNLNLSRVSFRATDVARVDSRQSSGSNDSLPAPLPVSTASDSQPSGINIPGSVGTLDSLENANSGSDSTPEPETNNEPLTTTTKATI